MNKVNLNAYRLEVLQVALARYEANNLPKHIEEVYGGKYYNYLKGRFNKVADNIIKRGKFYKLEVEESLIIAELCEEGRINHKDLIDAAYPPL